jgi:predicted ATPase
MRYLKKLIVTKEFRGIQPFTLELKDGINIIVGENGIGKSSLLSLISNETYKKYVKFDVEPNTTFRAFDTEKDNPRIKTDMNTMKNPAFSLNARFVSHGEAMLPLIKAIKDFNDCLIIIDEPEAGLSIFNQRKILKVFKESITKNNCQIILTTHSYVIIENAKQVFSMDNKKWIKSDEYLKNS